MIKSPQGLLAISLAVLTACSTNPPDKVEKIRTLQVPLVMSSAKSLPLPAVNTLALYRSNKQHIDNLTVSLKSQYLQDVTTRDIFERDSDIQPVYSALSQLEQLGLINQRYFKEQNNAGLQKIDSVLAPLIAG